MAKKLEQTLDLNFDDPTVEETERQQAILEDQRLEDSYIDYCSRPEAKKDARRARLKNPQNYDNLLEASVGVNIQSPESEDITMMRRHIINILGYTKLQGHGGEKILTVDAKPSRIVKMYKEYVTRAKDIQ